MRFWLYSTYANGGWACLSRRRAREMRLSISHFASDLGCKKELARRLSIGMEFIYIRSCIFGRLFDSLVLESSSLPVVPSSLALV
jgi:hypothetical protein